MFLIDLHISFIWCFNTKYYNTWIKHHLVFQNFVGHNVKVIVEFKHLILLIVEDVIQGLGYIRFFL